MPPKRKPATKPIVHDDVEDEDVPKKKRAAAKGTDSKSVSDEKLKKTSRRTAKQIKEEAEEKAEIDDATNPIGNDDVKDEEEVAPKRKRAAAKSSNGKSVSDESQKKTKKTAKQIKEEAEEKKAEKDAKKPIVHDDNSDDDDVNDKEDKEIIPPKRKRAAPKSSNGKSGSDESQKKTKKTAKQIKEEAEEKKAEKDAKKPIVHDDNSDDDDVNDKEDEEIIPPKRKRAAPKSSNGKSGSDESQKKTKKTAKQIKEEAEEKKAEKDVKKTIIHDDNSDDDDIDDKEDEEIIPPKRKRAAPKSSNGKSVSDEKQKKTKKTAKQIKEEAEEKKAEMDVKKPIVHDDDDDDHDDDDDDDNNEDKEEVAPKKKRAAAKSKSASGGKQKSTKKSAKQIKEEAEEKKATEIDMKTVVIKGKAPVDSYCTQKMGKAHVFCEQDDVWDAMLNQTNLQFNNNKYYLLQLLEDDVGMNYSVWLRWGRVGNKGQNKLHDCGRDLEKAKKIFKQKFQEKTKNDWDERDTFEKVSGKYDLLKMDYNPTEVKDKPDASLEVKKEIKLPASMLDQRVQALIELICNVKAMEEAVLEMKYDAKKAPLGKLTTEQIKAGYVALKEIEELINSGTTGSALVQACNNFYTRIPHNFGMKVPPLISNKVDLIQKLQLLEALGDIQIAMKMLNETSSILENPVDSHYKHLDCTLTPIERDSEMFKIIKEYLQNSHEKTHNHYKMELEDVFECNKENEFINHKNRMLLWHGSRLTNYVGILKQGLRIAPPEAPVTGYMFGKGVYFADRSSKSANYCCTTKSNNTGLMLLCEVSLGNINELLQSDYDADKLPKGKNSVKGLGSIVPDPTKQFKMEDGTIVPYGKGCQAQNTKGMTLNYNEYIVYDTKQIKMRYLVKVKFTYK